MVKHFTLLLIVAFSLAGCGKDGIERDTIYPVVKILSPANGDTFTNGQTISILGEVTDEQFVAEVHVHVTNKVTGVKLVDVHIYPNANTTLFNQPVTAVSGTQYKIEVIAKDRGLNETSAVVEVSCL